MKRILLITEYFRPDPGARETFFTFLAESWEKDKVQVAIVARPDYYMSSMAQRKSFEAAQSYKIERFYCRSIPLFYALGLSNGKLNDFLEDQIKDFQPEHIIFSDISSISLSLAVLAEKKGIPYSAFLNGSSIPVHLEKHRFLSRRFFLRASTIFTFSWYLARAGVRYGLPPANISVLPPGLKPRWQRQETSIIPTWLKKRYKEKNLLLSVGPLVARKGIDQAVRAISLLPEMIQDLHYVIVGSGPEYYYLREQIKNYQLEKTITLTGFVSDGFLGELYRQAQLFIQPGSKNSGDIESLGFVFMEAAWFGLPSIAGRAGGTEDVVIHEITGWMIETNDCKALSKQILSAILSQDERKKLGENAKIVSDRYFDSGRTLEVFRERLHSL